MVEVRVIRTTSDGTTYTSGRVTVGYGAVDASERVGLGWKSMWDWPL